MRYLPLLRPDGTVDDCLVGIVQASMMFPDDADSIEEDIGAFRLRAASGFRSTRLGERLNADFRTAQLGGMSAGSMLHKMIQYDRHHPSLKVGVNKSSSAVALELAEHGKPFDKDPNTVKKYWKQYKNSAHLWAAFMLGCEKTGVPVDFVSLVSLSQQIVDAGSHLVWEWDPWRAPPGFPMDGAATLEIELPDARNLSHVKRYRAAPKGRFKSP